LAYVKLPLQEGELDALLIELAEWDGYGRALSLGVEGDSRLRSL
jgi:hypothetical protein